jgi:AraC family transcriptional regulator
MVEGAAIMNVEIKTLTPMRVGAVGHVGPYNTIGKAFGHLGAVAGPSGLFAAPGAAMVGIFYDDPDTTAPEALRSEAGVVVSDTTALPAGLSETRLPGGEYVTTLHLGSYERLAETWARLKSEWLPASGRAPGDGPSFEIYWNNPGNAQESDLRTEVCIPLVPNRPA